MTNRERDEAGGPGGEGQTGKQDPSERQAGRQQSGGQQSGGRPSGGRPSGGQQGGGRAISRRRVLGTAGAAVGVAAAGGVAGAAYGRGMNPTPTLTPSGTARFAGKTVLITGATSGIGRAAALQFAAEGARVGFCGRRTELGAEVEREIRARGGEATYVRADVRDEASVQRFVDGVAQRCGGLDVCFNNAGITVQKPLAEYTGSEFDDVIHTNLRGNFYALKYEVPHLIAGGGGTVVVTSSSNALTTTGGKGAYTASKHGIVGLANSAAFDYAEHGIRVNTLIPGTTDTDLVRRVAGAEHLPDPAWASMVAAGGRSAPVMHRWATPDEIAAGALALASDAFPYMTASSLVLDGGSSAYS